MSQSEPVSTSPPVLDGATGSQENRVGRHQWVFLLRVVVVVLFVVFAYKVVRVGLHAVAVYDSLSELRDAAGRDMDVESLAQMQPAVGQVARSMAALEREVRIFAPALRASRVLPRIGPTTAAIPGLLSAGREYTFIADGALRLMLDEHALRPDATLQQLGALAVAANPEAFSLFGERAAVARQSLATVRTSGLLPSLSQPVAQLQSVSELAEVVLQVAPYATDLLGFEGPRRYLLLVQNNHELRATGGFISAVGLITIQDGKPGEIDLTDSYNIQRDDVDHPWAPKPMREHMGIELVFIRDSNWSPDLPTSGRLARTLYNQDAGTLVDGVITVDLRAVELLVGALGPLQVEGSDQPVTGENLVEQIKQFWNRPLETGDDKESAGEAEWWKQRKDFMPTLAQAALTRIREGKFDPLAVADSALTALDERAIQVWIVDPEVDEILAARGWNGAMQPVEGADFVGLIDTNMGYNKVDAVLERSMDHSVSWPDGLDQPALAETTVSYRHPVEVPGHECNQRPRYGDDYDAMTERCYFDYVRLYVPMGSVLLNVEGVDPESVEVTLGENGSTVMSGYFEMLPGSEHAVHFRYRLPSDIGFENYRLAVRRQAGSGSLAVKATVDEDRLSTIVTEGDFIWDPSGD